MKKLFDCLRDWNFESFVMTRIVKILYILAVVLSGIVCLQIWLMALFFKGALITPLLFVMGLLVAVVLVMLARVALETVIVIFRIAEELRMLDRGCTPIEEKTPGTNEICGSSPSETERIKL